MKEEAAMSLAKGLEYQTKWLLEQSFNPSAVIVFPSYEDWAKNMPECEKNGDTSLTRYWKERKEAIRMFALSELEGEYVQVKL